MYKSKLSKVIVSLLRRIAGVTRSGAKRLMRAMLQALMAMSRRARLPVAGFVLPTVTMVLLVVILLTVAIVFRSFDRANIARNVRVNQQVLAAATPALDRAKAKIQFLLYEDPQRPTSTPSDAELYRIMSANTPASDLYKFGDEERLILKYPVNPGNSLAANVNPQAPLEVAGTENQAINTAWRYPVDTNNDGSFDTFTLYGIFFRNPPINDQSVVKRARKPLDARTPPMALGSLDPACLSEGAGDSVATLVGDSGWYKLNGKLRKSFFVYTVNVPIEDAAEAAAAAAASGGNYKPFTGTSSISALEYQQDQSRIPLSNNAVVYEDDLEISPGANLNLNGRILTNSNLLVTRVNETANFNLFQVSSKTSCFYDQENSRIQVGGNVVNGWSGNLASLPVNVHLFQNKDPGNNVQPNTTPAIINPANQSAPTNNGLQVLYNGNAYSRRLNALVEGQQSKPETDDPPSVQLLRNPPAGSTQPPMSRANALESYFKDRLRKVPFAEAALVSNGGVPEQTVTPYTAYIQESKDRLRPIDNWILPTTGNADVGSASGSGRTELTLDLTQLASKNPENITSTASETNLGERVVVGNNLPALLLDGVSGRFGSKPQKTGGTWIGGGERERKSQVTKLADVGATDRGNGFGELPGTGKPPFRDGFWEAVAAQKPRNPLDGTGGLRVITSGGVYDRTNSFLPPPRWNDGATDGTPTSEIGPSPFVANASAANTYDDPATLAVVEKYPVVWPDTMPMSPLGLGSQVYDNAAPALPNTWIAWPGSAPAAPSVLGITELLPANAPKFAKGDLRMRATAVYHYAPETISRGYDPDTIKGAIQPDQKPYACVSSYYDPSNASTARNITTLPADVSGQVPTAPSGLGELGVRQEFIGSNNGITYRPTTKSRPPGKSTPVEGVLTGGVEVLDKQASLVFPDGRFANGPLRTALLVIEDERTLAQKAAIDSTYCALDILAGTITPDPDLIPHGAIQEVAFLNGREIKAIERDNPDTPNNEAFTLSGPLTNPPLEVNYNQPIEEREPLEIRATQLNIRALRQNRPQGSTTEWLLPNSGIIYASRDDALPDRSNRSLNPKDGLLDEATSKRVSPSDSILDPSRKPNGIVLINGNFLFRGGTTPNDPPARVTSVADIVREKGLTLVSNLPVYIQGEFNTHGRRDTTPPGVIAAPFRQVEEFKEIVNSTWGNFYQRTSDSNGLDPNFACRAGDPRLLTCEGDFWRPANVLADAVTLLSANYRFGFRNEGDFDLRNNAGAEAVLRRRQRGFFNNNFVTNGLSSGAFSENGVLVGETGARPTSLTDAIYASTITPPPITSSYFNNYVTPVQRRGEFPQYLMEACRKLPVSECTDADWFVNPLTVAPLSASVAAASAYATPSYIKPNTIASVFQAGSTVDPPIPELQRFPRRVAFNRDTNARLSIPPQPLGISGTTIAVAPAGTAPAARANSLWFAGLSGAEPVFKKPATPLSLFVVNAAATPPDRDGSNTPLPALIPGTTPEPVLPLQGTQPLLMPFLQIRNVTGTAAAFPGNRVARETGWVSRADVDTTFNLIMATGDTPSLNIDGAVGDFNGGLQNLPRFLENWSVPELTTNIKGSFIQLNRSAFSTAPYQSILGLTGIPPVITSIRPADRIIKSVFGLSTAPSLSPEGSAFNYNSQGFGNFSYFSPPNRNWGYDVGLLPQPPDLFTQKFTTPPSRSQPAEFFREVPRNDEWVKTLMCGVLEKNPTSPAGNGTSSRPTDCPT